MLALKEYINELLDSFDKDTIYNNINENAANMTSAATSHEYDNIPDHFPTPLETLEALLMDIKTWWYDKKAKNIITKKLLDDKDVEAYFKQSKRKQRSGWRDLIKSKLTEDEYKYLNKITKEKVQTQLINKDERP